MWLFRKRPEDLTPEQAEQLQTLIAAIPDLELAYYVRTGITNIFDSPLTRDEAARQIEDLRKQLDPDDEDNQTLLEFFNTYDAQREGILAYFDERKTSGPVEGLNNKARVITKRCYGIKSIPTLHSRLCLDINLKSLAIATRTVAQMHTIINNIRQQIAGYYT